MKTIGLLTALALFAIASVASGAGPLLSENFNSGNGGFTVSTPIAYDGPWVYSAGTGSWREDGQQADNGHPNTSSLSSPVVNVPNAGVVTVTFAHRYSFEFDGTRWDGGQLLVSVNGGAFTTVPDASFMQNGYGGNTVASNSVSALAGQPAFTAESSGYATDFLTSRAVLGVLNAGDTVRVQFLAASDTNTRGTVPNWEIDSVVVATLDDVTKPGDPIVGTSNNSPGSEGVTNAIDDLPTKYLNFDKLNTGFTVTPGVGRTLVRGLTLTSANDAPERDPASYTLEGSDDGVTFTLISSGTVPVFPSRFFKQRIFFANNAPYLKYRLIFPTVANAAAANSMAVSEVELLGVPTLVVTNTNDSGSGSLRQALANAAFNPGADTVTFDAALSGATIVLGNEFVINDATGAVTIDATGLPGGVTISGDGTNRIFTVSSGKTLALTALALTGGNGVGTTFTGNGGAILNALGTLTLTRCTLSGNSASFGGAISSETSSDFISSSTRLTHCSVSGNTATFEGGGLRNVAGRTILTHCTVSGNTAPAGRGSGVSSSGNANTETVVENSVIAGNTNSDVDFSSGVVTTNTFTSSGHNLIGTGNATADFNQAGDITGNTNPLLAPLGNYGGPTRTMLPLPGSPAIDAATVIAGLTTDQRGFPRNLDGDGDGFGTATPDIGAVEFGRVGVNTNADQLDTPSGGIVSLREALRDGADFVVFHPALVGQNFVLGSQLEVAKYVTIDASSFATGMVVSGNLAGRVFHIAPGVSASFVRLTITTGQTSGSFPNGYGGGVYVEGALLLTECSVVGNSANVGGGAYVAGAATLTLNRSTVSGNAAGFGGGIQNEGTLVGNACTFAQNAAAQDGGAISAPFGRPVTLKHCTISLNNAATGGGAIGNSITLENTILSGNTAPTGPNISGTLNVSQSITGGNALLAPLDNYGGPTRTMALLPGSPARNTALAPVPTNDQRGFPIVGTPDIGAYEAGTFTNYNAFIWETLPVSATAPQHATTFDFDGDGATNGDEFIAGTVVTNPASVLRISNVTKTGTTLAWTFPTVVGRIYRFDYSYDLISWTSDPGGVAGDGNPHTSFLGVSSSGPRFFIRVRVGP